ncbi:pentatricopeptide repeat-containing protein At2g29760, chloroplastic-like isoform X2 [Prunus avium]|uniref:Pentatricopeptide repeat-containing protein At2g29760, chloroplastic-like isoform X1 n=1 Tax=Prunus avium TaxID=42229 RepID=A0A6P5SU63_PRUAV|nr:pentatricopeptide repeat-containing protein At2g29760, chloroplastic-like isoform X1 [Prunus avium]XP_021817717.1 pentatricopeptide repeat-containing protein At2g29760, chloroplastic-like isoform X2 [Prunus avium]
MAAPLSLHHIRLPFSSDNPILHNKPTTSTAIAATPITTATKTSRTNNPIEPHPCLALLDKCSTMSELKQIHAQLLRTGLFFDAFTASKVVAFSALEGSGSLHYARLVLTQIPNPTTYTCNSVIRGYTNKDLPREAIFFYQEMIIQGWVPDRFTFPSLFKSCGDLWEGKQLHCHSTKLGFVSDSYIQNTLMNMYSNCGCLISARKVFDKMLEKSVVSWATMIDAYAHWDQPIEAVKLFDKMESESVDPNEVTLVNVLTACAKARDLKMAKRVHQYIEEYGFGNHLKLNTALMDVYCKCGCVLLARDLFDKMPEKNLFSWNIMINGHVEDSNYDEAFLLFREMQLKGEKGDKVTMVSLLLACSHLGALELGKWLHAYIEKEKIELDVALGTTLVDMYAKCGSIDGASEVFRKLPEKDVMTWTALISGFAMCGQGKKALEHFHEMQMSGVKPDAITFVGVLAACSHAGLVDEGISHFNSMHEVYGIQPSIEHYGCMVDILGRAGRIAEAEELIRKMQMPPDRFVLGGLLGACRVHGNLEAAERAAQQLLELDPDDDGAYVLLSNLYSSMKKWKEAKRIRELMAERNVKKAPGCSLIEVDGIVHEFVKGDSSHPQSTNIYEMLQDMIERLKKAGYVPEKSEVLLDIDEEEKETALSLHSEKLAIAFGLISTNPGTTIRVVKNLRVCSDCHTATKIISKVYNREIIVRDRNRFHRFQDGSCSCKDFW